MEQNPSSTLLLTSEGFPPLLDGSALLVTAIFSGYKGKFYAVAGTNFTRYDPTFKPPCKTWYIRYPRNRLFEALSRRIHHWFLPIYYFVIYRVSKKIKPTVIYANYPHEVLFVASYQVAKKLNIPLFLYMHDLWEENMPNAGRKRFAKKWEKIILTNADKLICSTPSQQIFYQNKYGIGSDLILHAVPDEDIIPADQLPPKKPSDKITIAYSGSMSAVMHYDAFVQIGRALKLLPDNFQFFWYSINPLSDDLLTKLGLLNPKVHIKHLERSEYKEALRNVDILIAPLSHKNCSKEEVRVLFANKLLGYFVSGTPILVFGPPDCHHVLSAKEGGWGYVVDKDDPKVLADAFILLSKKGELTERLVQNAIREAERRKVSTQAALIKQWVDEYSHLRQPE